MATLHLKQGPQERLAGGHLWIYAGEIASMHGRPAPGDVVDVRTADGAFLGRGTFNPRSTIAVRLLTQRREAIDGTWLHARMADAAALRERIVSGTSAYRLVYSEGDRLPGLVVDRYAEVLVVQILTAGMARFQPAILAALQELFQPAAVYARHDAVGRRYEGLPQTSGFLAGEASFVQEITEGGARFRVDVSTGQKTGFFLDQRENRQTAAAYAAILTGRGAGAPEALDAFCYTGGFSVHLAQAGCRVHGIDVSEAAVATAAENARLNGVEDRCTFQAGNAFDLLRAMAKEPPRFDLVVLDPPAFARSRSTVPAAAAGYKEINLRALKMLRPGGMLISCSCSAHVSEELLIALVAEAAHDARRTVRLLEARTQARDHPIHPGMPETRYLKCLILEVT